MRIGIFHNRYRERGGEDTAVDAESQLLAKAGHAVVRCVVDNDSELRGALGVARAAWRARWNPATETRVERWLAGHPIDVAHVHNFFPLLSPALHAALHARGVPVVQTLHNYRLACANGLFLREGRACEDCVVRGPWNAVRHGCYRGSRLGTAVWADLVSHHRRAGTWERCVDRFVAPSDFARRKLAAAGLDAGRIAVLPLSSTDPGEPAPPGRGAVYVGRLSREKGADLLVDAWRQLSGERGFDAPLAIVGGGPEAGALRERAAGLPNVRFLGALPREGVVRALREAAFCVVPSRCYENSPFAAIEALSCGRPVVGWRDGAAAELAPENEAGLHFDATQPASVAAACRRLLGDPQLVARLGAAARERYLDRHTPAAALERLEALYREVIAARRS